MSVNRYTPVVEQLAARIALERSGIGILVVPPGQHTLVAEAIAIPEDAVGVLAPALLQSSAHRLIVTGLPKERSAATAALTELNGRRDWLRSRGKFLLLLLSRTELAEMQRFAGDAYATQLLLEFVPFIPDTTVNEPRARNQFLQWQRECFGRVDLRGFIRSETEDVSWHVEDIYQVAKARPSYFDIEGEHLGFKGDQPIQDWIAYFGRAQPYVVLGHPGSGKTFLLRWIATQAGNNYCGIQQPLPLLISLSAFAQHPGPIGLLEYIQETLLEAGQPIASALTHIVSQGRAIFLLDGLDETGDAFFRRRISSAIEDLQKEASNNLIITTSRISGYDGGLSSALLFILSAFDDEAIRMFLLRWCELYARDRLGDTPYAAEQGRHAGIKLAEDVLSHPEIRDLARNPLLLTVLAIVHRAGVRLPDHRVELYEHATRVLVERWNRIRSLSETSPHTPLKSADAVRLLGPVALDLIRSGVRGAIPEERLRKMLARALAKGGLKAVATPDEAIHLFKNALGLLVEQGPGLYAFLHLTLAEYFAAWEAIRSAELESMAADPALVASSVWREVFLLAAGELGINRADDLRLSQLIAQILSTTERLLPKPSPAVPSLLAGLLADDPGLDPATITKILDTLIPKWWFDSDYGLDTGQVIAEARQIIGSRLKRTSFFEELRRKLSQRYETRVDPNTLPRFMGVVGFDEFIALLVEVDIDYTEAFIAVESATLGIAPQSVIQHGNNVQITLEISQLLYQMACENRIAIQMRTHAVLLHQNPSVCSWPSVPLNKAEPVATRERKQITVRFELPYDHTLPPPSGSVFLVIASRAPATPPQ